MSVKLNYDFRGNKLENGDIVCRPIVNDSGRGSIGINYGVVVDNKVFYYDRCRNLTTSNRTAGKQVVKIDTPKEVEKKLRKEMLIDLSNSTKTEFGWKSAVEVSKELLKNM